MFQFHKGSIDTWLPSCWRRACRWFQFHKGSIDTGFEGVCAFLMRGFNSIKVRLIHHQIQEEGGFNNVSIP